MWLAKCCSLQEISAFSSSYKAISSLPPAVPSLFAQNYLPYATLSPFCQSLGNAGAAMESCLCVRFSLYHGKRSSLASSVRKDGETLKQEHALFLDNQTLLSWCLDGKGIANRFRCLPSTVSPGYCLPGHTMERCFVGIFICGWNTQEMPKPLSLLRLLGKGMWWEMYPEFARRVTVGKRKKKYLQCHWCVWWSELQSTDAVIEMNLQKVLQDVPFLCLQGVGNTQTWHKLPV